MSATGIFPFSLKHTTPGISSRFRGYVSTSMSDLPQININTLIVHSGATINQATISNSTFTTTDVGNSITADSFTSRTGIFTKLEATGLRFGTVSGTSATFDDSTIAILMVTDSIDLPISVDSGTGLFNHLEANYAGMTNLTGINLSYTTITGISITNGNLTTTNATTTTLTGTNINSTDFTSTNSSITFLTGTKINSTDLTSTNASITTLTGTTINTTNALTFPATTGDKIALRSTTDKIGIDSNRIYFNVGDSTHFSEFRNAGVGKTRITNTSIEPVTTSSIDLGTSALYFNNGHVNYINSTSITGTTINSTNRNVTTLTSTNSSSTNLTSTNITGTTITGANANITNITGVSNLNSANLILGSSANKTTIVATTPSSARTLTVPDPGASANLLLSSTLSNTQTTNSRLDFTQGANVAMMSYGGGVGSYFFYTNTLTGTRLARLPETGYESFNDFIMAEGAQTLNDKTLTNATLTDSTLSSENSTITNATITNLTGTSARITTITGVSTLNSVTISGVSNLNSTNSTITSITGVSSLSFGSFSASKSIINAVITATGIRSMFSNPITIIPAVSGRINVIRSGIANYDFDTSAFNSGGNIKLLYTGSSPINAIETAISSVLLTTSANTFKLLRPPQSGPNASSNVINRDIIITNDTSSFTDGGDDATLSLSLEVFTIIGN